MISSNEVMYVITEIKDHFDEKIILHMHNDRGLVKATALAGIEAGASAILGTFAGIGERSGNVPLEEVIKNLSDKYDVQLKANTRMIRELCQLVQQYTGVYVHPHKPICGKSVLTHKTGIHLHAIQKNPENYELFPPRGNR